MFYQLVIAISGIAVLLGFWIVFQNWIRKQTPELSDDCDVLEGRFGCGDCAVSQSCVLENSVRKQTVSLNHE